MHTIWQGYSLILKFTTNSWAKNTASGFSNKIFLASEKLLMRWPGSSLILDHKIASFSLELTSADLKKSYEAVPFFRIKKYSGLLTISCGQFWKKIIVILNILKTVWEFHCQVFSFISKHYEFVQSEN